MAIIHAVILSLLRPLGAISFKLSFMPLGNDLVWYCHFFMLLIMYHKSMHRCLQISGAHPLMCVCVQSISELRMIKHILFSLVSNLWRKHMCKYLVLHILCLPRCYLFDFFRAIWFECIREQPSTKWIFAFVALCSLFCFFFIIIFAASLNFYCIRYVPNETEKNTSERQSAK